MINRSIHHRAPGIAWALMVLVLIAGIVAMHSAVFGTAHASAGGAEHAAGTHAVDAPTGSETHPAALPAHVDVMPVAMPNTTAPAEDPHAGSGCGSAGCDEHAAVHSCVFVLVALAAAMALVLLYRLTDDLAAIVAAAARPWRGRRERPPPWTVLSLAQLAILRI